MSRLCVLLLLFAAPFAPAFAQDDLLEDEDLLDDLEDSNTPGEQTKRLDEADELDVDDEPADDTVPTDAPAEDLLDAPVDDAPEDGVDNAATYRAYEARLKGYEVEQEVEAWERYLERYPNSIFRDRIDARVESLMDILYGDDIVKAPDDTPVDAKDQEVRLQQAVLLQNINPRTNFQVGFEFGLPSYLNLFISEEWAFTRKWSVHGALRNRFTGYNLEVGTSYALVKSERTQTIVTVRGDLHFNMTPSFLGIRPTIGAGKIFFDKLHVQAQFGFDVELRAPVGVRYQGGANVTFMAAPVMAVFLEANTSLKHLLSKETKAYHFTTATLGLKFMPKFGKMKQGQIEINTGASLPVTHNYWAYTFGSFLGQANFYHAE